MTAEFSNVYDDRAYAALEQRAGLMPINAYRPLARQTAAGSWVSETTIAPWAIYVLGHAEQRGDLLPPRGPS